MNWNDLSMAERTKYIKLGLENNITDLNIIRDTYNMYANGGSYNTDKSSIIQKEMYNPITIKQSNRNWMENNYYNLPLQDSSVNTYGLGGGD